jgi:hypothetical protein
MVRRDTLAARANIDSRMADVLCVSVRVHTNHPDGVPTIARQQYGAAEGVQRQCAVRFISTPTGIDVAAPDVPRYLLQSGDAFTAAVAKLTTAQRAWHDTLVSQAAKDFDVVRGGASSVAALADACEWLWAHLLKAVPDPHGGDGTDAPLWPDRSSVASSWADLLSQPGTCILNNSRPQQNSNDEFHWYQLRVHGANPLLTHILACQLWSYDFLHSLDPTAFKAWIRLLRGEDVAASTTSAHGADATDCSSSDSDDGWSQPRAMRKRIQARDRHERSLPKRVADFRKKYMVGKLAERFKADTGSPLLALSTSIKVRAWERRYNACLLDNFESVGCDVTDLNACPLFKKMSTSILGLTHPVAGWSVNQHNGGADVTLFIREESRDLLPTLNTKVQQLFPGTQPQLRMKCSLQQTDARGRVMRNSPLLSIFLNETVPVIPRVLPAQRRAALASPSAAGDAASAPPPGSWAAAVMLGVKRLPDTVTLDHRPKKNVKPPAEFKRNGGGATGPPSGPPPKAKQPQQQHKQSTTWKQPMTPPSQTGNPSAPSSSTAPRTAQATVVDFQQSDAWKEMLARQAACEQRQNAAMAALEQRLNDLQASTSSAVDAMTRTLDAITTRFEQRLDISSSQVANSMAELHLVIGQLAQRFDMLTSVVTSAAPMPHRPGTPSSLAVSLGSGAAGDSRISHHPTAGNTTAHVIAPTTAASASASPALNGQSARHG